MSKYLGLMVMIIGIGGGVSFAGITDIEFLYPTDPPTVDHISSVYDPFTETLTLIENYIGEGPDDIVFIGMTDSDPVFHISKTVDNSNAQTWTGFDIALDPLGDATFDYTVNPSSDKFTVIETMDPFLLVFAAPVPVEVGQSVTLDFDILLPEGAFQYTMTQEAIPEPATLCLLGFGGLALLKRRR